MIKIMISDPDQFVREGIKGMLGQFGDLYVICEASGALETFKMLEAWRPDICIIEIAIDQYYGLGFLRETKSKAGDTEILVMSHRLEHGFALRAMRAGASGYLNKGCTAQELAHAVRMAAQHRPYLSHTLCELIAESVLHESAQEAHNRLSDRDFEILVLMAHSAAPAQIASTCKISVPAARSHRKNIMRKMNLRTDAGVIAYAIEHGLIDSSNLLDTGAAHRIQGGT